MKFGWIILSAVVAVGMADAASAKPRKAYKPRAAAACVDGPKSFSWNFLLPGNSGPQPNGCAPAVFEYGQYVGQDPDAHIRAQLRRDPGTGYSVLNNR